MCMYGVLRILCMCMYGVLRILCMCMYSILHTPRVFYAKTASPATHMPCPTPLLSGVNPLFGFVCFVFLQKIRNQLIQGN